MVKSAAGRILVVDDDPGVRQAVVRMLKKGGHQVESAASGEEAALRLDGGFDILLTDLSLGGAIDGNELTRRFKAAGLTDVVIMTAHPDLDTAVVAIRDGAYDYLVKPVSDGTLRAVVGRCLEKRALSAELSREKALRAELRRAYEELSELSGLRRIFGQFATPEVARVVLSHPKDFRSRGERRRVTVLFADVRGFTDFAARVRAEDATEALNEVFTDLQDCVHREGGIVNKFLGDGAMALFGAPLEREGHEAAACRAALRAQQALARTAARRRGAGLEALGVGMGINTGEVVAGCLGSKDRTEYTVIGSPVNIAARLEKSAEPGQVLVGPETGAAVEEEFSLEEMGEHSFRGVRGPVRVRSLRALKEAAL